MTITCSWCQTVMRQGDRALPVSHSCCPRCVAKLNAELDVLDVERVVEETARMRRVVR